MAVHGKGTVVLGDEVALTGYLNQVQVSKSAQAVNVTTFGNDDKVFIAGVEEGTISLSGLFDAAGSDTELHGALGAASGKLLTVGVDGLTVGNRVSVAQAREASYSLQNPSNDAVRLNASFTCDGGVRSGVSLHALEAETATADFASVDNGDSTANGGVGYLHVTAFTGTDVTIKIQDSADDAAWADLISFSSVTGVTQERSIVAGTVDRYVRAQISGGTFTSVTFAVAFARDLK